MVILSLAFPQLYPPSLFQSLSIGLILQRSSNGGRHPYFFYFLRRILQPFTILPYALFGFWWIFFIVLRKSYQGPCCGTVGYVGTYNTVGVPATLLPIEVPANMSGKAMDVDPSGWALPPLWETSTEFLVPAFALDQTWLLESNQWM